MQNRRNFLKISALAGLGTAFGPFASAQKKITPKKPVNKPIVLSTWRFGIEANAEAWKIFITKRPQSLDAGGKMA